MFRRRIVLGDEAEPPVVALSRSAPEDACGLDGSGGCCGSLRCGEGECSRWSLSDWSSASEDISYGRGTSLLALNRPTFVQCSFSTRKRVHIARRQISETPTMKDKIAECWSS